MEAMRFKFSIDRVGLVGSEAGSVVLLVSHGTRRGGQQTFKGKDLIRTSDACVDDDDIDAFCG